MFWMDKSKVRPVEMPMADGLPPDILIGPGTRRAGRLPTGQSAPRSGRYWMPAVRLRLICSAGVWDDFLKMPRVKVFADFHCVTRWSRLGNVWEGVSTRELLRQAGARSRRPPKRWPPASTSAGWTTCLSPTFWARTR